MKNVKSSLTAATLSVLAIATLATTSAEARPSTQEFSCAGVQNFVEDRGAVVMNTTKSWVYRRFVAHRGFCERGERVVRYSVPTQSGRCGLRICKEPLRWKN